MRSTETVITCGRCGKAHFTGEPRKYKEAIKVTFWDGSDLVDDPDELCKPCAREFIDHMNQFFAAAREAGA